MRRERCASGLLTLFRVACCREGCFVSRLAFRHQAPRCRISPHAQHTISPQGQVASAGRTVFGVSRLSDVDKTFHHRGHSRGRFEGFFVSRQQHRREKPSIAKVGLSRWTSTIWISISSTAPWKTELKRKTYLSTQSTWISVTLRNRVINISGLVQVGTGRLVCGRSGERWQGCECSHR